MSLFDGDPQFEELRRIREDEGYTGPLDENLNRVDTPEKEQAWREGRL